MKTYQEIQAEIAGSRLLPKFDCYPAVMECWNEYEKLWRDDNGFSYVQQNGITIFSHLTERFTQVMEGIEPVKLYKNSSSISLEELAAIKPGAGRLVKGN
jgi:hypothetical protein